MPEISRFYGIIIRIHIPDHAPPHFHALYSGQEALFDIDSLSVMQGRISTRARRLVVEWASLHQDELLTAWEHAQNYEPLGKIAPLE